jgi:hypothetical protein
MQNNLQKFRLGLLSIVGIWLGCELALRVHALASTPSPTAEYHVAQTRSAKQEKTDQLELAIAQYKTSIESYLSQLHSIAKRSPNNRPPQLYDVLEYGTPDEKLQDIKKVTQALKSQLATPSPELAEIELTCKRIQDSVLDPLRSKVNDPAAVQIVQTQLNLDSPSPLSEVHYDEATHAEVSRFLLAQTEILETQIQIIKNYPDPPPSVSLPSLLLPLGGIAIVVLIGLVGVSKLNKTTPKKTEQTSPVEVPEPEFLFEILIKKIEELTQVQNKQSSSTKQSQSEQANIHLQQLKDEIEALKQQLVVHLSSINGSRSPENQVLQGNLTSSTHSVEAEPTLEVPRQPIPSKSTTKTPAELHHERFDSVIRVRIANMENTIIFQKSNKGNYKILNTWQADGTGSDLLLPMPDISLNLNNLEFMEQCFETKPSNVRIEQIRKVTVICPAIMKPIVSQEQWELRERGIIQFELQ